jgi:hypothetical protein
LVIAALWVEKGRPDLQVVLCRPRSERTRQGFLCDIKTHQQIRFSKNGLGKSCCLEIMHSGQTREAMYAIYMRMHGVLSANTKGHKKKTSKCKQRESKGGKEGRKGGRKRNTFVLLVC